MNKFIIELPNFKYNKQDLYNFQNSITEWESNHLFSNFKGLDTSEVGFFNYHLRNINHPILSEIISQFNFMPSDNDVKFSKILKGGALPFHRDRYRSNVLMIPISENPSKIEWKINNQIAYTHTYTCATIINGTIKHGVSVNNNDRIFLQIKIPGKWQDLLDNLELFFKF